MVDFYDDEHKALDAAITRVRVLLAERPPLAAADPQIIVAPAQTTNGDTEITAALAVTSVTGKTSLEAVEKLEVALGNLLKTHNTVVMS